MGNIRIGTAGWSYRDWEGIVYPAGTGKQFDRLSDLAGFFDTIEVNVTFYRLPLARHCESWVERTAHNPAFKFTLKLHRNFTHRMDELTPSDENRWREGIRPLEESGRLGAVLVQFPYSFHYTVAGRDYITGLTDRFPDLPLVIEVRHRSWDRPEVFRFLADIGVGFCNIDQPRLSYSLLPSSSATSPVGYVRLHGRNVRDWFRKSAGRDERYNYLYSGAEITEWMSRIKEIAEKTRELYVITNNHYRGQAVCNALQLKAGIEEGRIGIPPALIAAYPRLKILMRTRA